VLVPLLMRFMRAHPQLQIELNFEDRYVNLVEQGMDVAIRMGRLEDSTLGARYLGLNPWCWWPQATTWRRAARHKRPLIWQRMTR
jgi:DNA-binding transcriptional LysR family regulator